MRLEATSRWRSGDIGLFLLTPDRVSDAYVAWLNDPEINRFLESRFDRQDRVSVEAYVAAVAASPRDLFFGIEERPANRHVGNIKLGPIDRHHGLAEIGIMIGDRNVWGRGIAPQAIDLVAGIAAHELGLRRLTAGCYASNVGSRKAFEKAGFTVEALRPAHFLLDGSPEDGLLMGRLIGRGQEDRHAHLP